MKRIRDFFRRLDLFDALSLGLIAVIFIMALVHISRFPVFKDIYYHMGTAKAFGSAGGVSLFDFWEYAPAGRPHLYPPMLHIIMYVMNLTGMSMSTIGTLVSFSAFHLILLSTWYGMRRLFSSRAAFYTVIVLSSCFMFFWATAVTSAASLVLILTPFIFIALEADRKVAACVLLALALYSHLVLGHLIALGVLIYVLHRREMFKGTFLVLFGAYLLWLPWGIHILVNFGTLDLSSPTGGGTWMSLHILVWVIAIAGFIYCYFKKGRYYIPTSLLLGMVPILFFYPNRFWDGHAFVPLAMLGGVALSGLHGFIKERSVEFMGGRQSYRVVLLAVMAVPVALLLLVDPVFSTRNSSRPGNDTRNVQAMPDGMRPSQGTKPSTRDGNGESPPGGTLPPQMEGGGPGGESGQSVLIGYDRREPPEMGDIPPWSLEEESGGTPRDEVGNEPRSFPNNRMATPESGGSTGSIPGGPGGGPAQGKKGQSGDTLYARSSTLLYLITGEGSDDGMHSLEQEPMLNEETEALARMVEENSEEDQVVFTTDGSFGNLITGLTGRPTTGGMFKEVQSEGSGGKGKGMTSGMEDAYLLILPAGTGPLEPSDDAVPSTASGDVRQGLPEIEGIDPDSLEYVGTAGKYALYLNPAAVDVRTSGPGTVIPWVLVFLLLGLAIAVIIIDWVHPIHPLAARKRAGDVSTGADTAPPAPPGPGNGGDSDSR